jgi:6-pyruvoyltetrahydropterin/6-carboxytetrahydropterin synthase
MHGHSWRVDVEVIGRVNPSTGMVMDFGSIKAMIEPIVQELDHKHINTVLNTRTATSENIGAWIKSRLMDGMRRGRRSLPYDCLVIRVWEGMTAFAEV